MKEISIPTYNTSHLSTRFIEAGGNTLTPLLKSPHSLFHINRIEDYIKLSKEHLKKDTDPFRLTVFTFMFLTKGYAIKTKGIKRFQITSNSFFFVPAFEITSNEYISDDSAGFYCHFNLDLLAFDFKVKGLLSDFPFLNFNSYPVIQIDNSIKNIITQVLSRLELEYKKGDKCSLQVVRAYLIAIFMELLPFVLTSKNSSDDPAYQITREFKRALAQFIYDKQKIEDYAELLNINSNLLNKYVKSVTGKRANELLNDMILLEAKSLLKQTTLSISEITYKLGQEHISNFTRFFKSKTGLTPGDFRNEFTLKM